MRGPTEGGRDFSWGEDDEPAIDNSVLLLSSGPATEGLVLIAFSADAAKGTGFRYRVRWAASPSAVGDI